MALLDWAAQHAETLLAPLSERWAHTRGVVTQADQVTRILPDEDRDYLVAAAYLHDVGYAPGLVRFGFHPLDGAVHLRDVGQERLASLVAYHSASAQEAEMLGLSQKLEQFKREQSDTALALTYCDVTTGRSGTPVSLNDRFADLKRQYGCEHPVTQAVRLALPELQRCVAVVEERLRGNEPNQASTGWSRRAR